MDKQNLMTELISQWKLSGLTKSMFCNNHQISIHQFKYWLKKLSQSEVLNSDTNEIRFFSIENQTPKKIPPKTTCKPSIIVELPNGIKINFFSC